MPQRSGICCSFPQLKITKIPEGVPPRHLGAPDLWTLWITTKGDPYFDKRRGKNHQSGHYTRHRCPRCSAWGAPMPCAAGTSKCILREFYTRRLMFFFCEILRICTSFILLSLQNFERKMISIYLCNQYFPIFLRASREKHNIYKKVSRASESRKICFCWKWTIFFNFLRAYS